MKGKSRERYLFKGDSCYPISADEKTTEPLPNDQLLKILEGHPNLNPKSDFGFITNDIE
jgi:hypothetical protein